MDMLKKARGKAMQAVKEVQKEVQVMMQAPGQQAQAYGQSSSHTPYQQYGQQYPPQIQSFQAQYTVSNQPHPQVQGQTHFSGHYPQNTQQSQNTQAHGGQQSPPIPQPYAQSHGQHGQPPQQQAQQQFAQSPNQQYPTPQGPHVHKLPPPYTPQPIQGFQGFANSAIPQQSIGSPPPQHSVGPPPGQQQSFAPQPQQHVIGSLPPQGHYITHSQQPYQHGITSPAPSVGSSQFSVHSQQPTPTYQMGQVPQQSQSVTPQTTHHQQGYFSPVPGQPMSPASASPAFNSPPHGAPQHGQLNSHLPTQYTTPPPIPQGQPQTTSPPTQVGPSVPTSRHETQSQQHSVQSLPPRYSTISPGPSPHVQQSIPSPAHTPLLAQNNVPPNQLSNRPESQFPTSSPPPPFQSPYLPTPPPASATISSKDPGISSPTTQSSHPTQPIQQTQDIGSIYGNLQQQQNAQSPHPTKVLQTQSPNTPSYQPRFNHTAPSPSLTPAPLNLRTRTSSTVSSSHRPLSSLGAPLSQDGQVPQGHGAGRASPIPASVSPPRVHSPPSASTTPYQSFVRQDAARITSLGPQNQLEGGATDNQAENSNLPAVASYQPFSATAQGSLTPRQGDDYQQNSAPRTSISHLPVTSNQSPQSNDSQDQRYTAFKPVGTSPVQDCSQSEGSFLPYPMSTNVADVQPLFTLKKEPLISQYSPPAAVSHPHTGDRDTPPRNDGSAPKYERYGAQDMPTSNPVELPPGLYEMSSDERPSVIHDKIANQPAVVNQPPIEYADGLMLADEDSNFASHKQPGTNLVRVPPSIAVKSQTATRSGCTGFQPTLTDTNQYFEMRPDFMQHYHIPTNEGGTFAICDYCYHNYITPYPWLAVNFYPRPRAARPADNSLPQISFEKLIGCGMAFPRIRHAILYQTIPTKNIQPFIEYARLDATLPPCTGEPQGGSYYGTPAIASIAVCKSCLECYIKNTAFESHFTLQKLPSIDQQWACDIGYSGYVQRTLLHDIAQNPPNFGHFAAAANKRLAMPPCTGHKQPIACSGVQGSTIFRSVRDNCGVFCSGCFHDKVVGTSAEHSFGYEIEIDDDQKAALSCDLTFEFSMDAMDNAVRANNFDVWHAPIVANNTAKFCPSITGIDERDLDGQTDEPMWYCFKGCSNIEVCGKCYGTRVVTYQAEELFEPIIRTPTPGRIRQCYLSPAKDMHSTSWDPLDYENTTAWRGQYLRNVLQYGMDAGGNFTVAKQAAARIAALPPPCGSELRKFTLASGRKFFGHQASDSNNRNDATILMCEECFHATAKATPLESFFSNDLTNVAYQLSPEGHRCSTWSVQTKRRLRQACLTNSFASYAQYHHQREQVFEALWTSMRELEPLNQLLKQHTANINAQTQLNLQMGSLRLAQQLNSQMNAQIMGIGGSVAEAASPDYGVRYGNSTVGMNYLTSAGANAAMAQHNAANLPGLNLAMWQGASTERLTTEVQRRLDIQNELREQWRILD